MIVVKAKRPRVTLRAVRAKCLECLNRDRVEFDCEIPDCPLYTWQPWKGRRGPCDEEMRS